MSCNNIYLAKKEVNGEQVQKKTWRFTRLLFYRINASSQQVLVDFVYVPGSLVSFLVPSEEKLRSKNIDFEVF